MRQNSQNIQYSGNRLLFLGLTFFIPICYQCATSPSTRAFSRINLGRHLVRSNLLLLRVQDPAPTSSSQTLVSGLRYSFIGLSPLADLMVPGEFKNFFVYQNYNLYNIIYNLTVSIHTVTFHYNFICSLESTSVKNIIRVPVFLYITVKFLHTT